MMQSITSSFQQIKLSNASSIVDRALTRLVGSISTKLTPRGAIVRLKPIEHNRHEFESALLAEPTKCPGCNNMIWLPHGQRCKLCKLISHMKCLNRIDTTCHRASGCQSELHTSAHKLNAMQMGIQEPTFCDHCGTCIMFRCRYEKCSSCLRNFHKDCVDLVAPDCRARKTDDMLKEQRSSERSSPVTLNQFDILALLGTGSFSKVYLARRKSTSDDLFAIKVVKKTNPVISGDPAGAFNEWHCLQIGRTYPFLTIAHCCFQTPDRLFFVMDYIEGKDLLYYVNEEGAFSEDRVRYHAGEIVLALIYLHKNDIVYRDLKLNNVILDRYGHCKLIDFGMSKQLQPQNQMRTRTFCGTVFYLSPEILRGCDYDFSVDWWSLGVLMYEMLCDSLPFNGRNDDEIFDAILAQKLTYPANVRLSDRARSLLDGLLEKEPNRRIGCDLMEDCAAAIKKHSFFLRDTAGSGSLLNDWWCDMEAMRIRPPYIPEQMNCQNIRETNPTLTPVASQQLDEIPQSYFDNFSQCGRSFIDTNPIIECFDNPIEE